MRRFARAILRLYCADCQGVIWAWQPRCGHRHTRCAHEATVRSWQRNLDATGGPERPWACSYCGVIPE